MRNHFGYSISNISGLAIGMSACFLILLFVRYELNWNDNNKNLDRIYRVQQKVLFKNDIEIYMQTGYRLASELKNQIPEIENAAAVGRVWEEYLSTSDRHTFDEKRGYYADDNMFKIFTFSFLQGDPGNALSAPYSVVISKELADKYFPGENPFGKTIRASKNRSLKVTGVFEDLPSNDNVRPDYIVSMSTYREVTDWEYYDRLENIGSAIFETFVMLKPNTSPNLVDKKIYDFSDKYVPDNYKKLYLKHLSEIHLTGEESRDFETALYYIGGFAIFVLILGCINFINLATANSYLRKKEIGVRKIVGASRFTLFVQFIGESLIFSFISMLVACMLVEVSLPYFNAIVQRQIEINVSRDIGFILGMVSAFLITGILSGVYPALYLSSFRPVQVIKGNLSLFKQTSRGSSKSFLRKSLVTFQFCISIALLISTVYVVKQVHFMKNKDLGFEKQNLLVCNAFGQSNNGHFETLRNELLNNPNVIDASVSINAPFHGDWGKEITWEGAAPSDKMSVNYNSVSYSFIDTYKMKMVLGRNFSRQFPSDSTACVVNETAWKMLKWKNPLGKKIDDNKYTIIGVVKDFHPYTVHEKIPPFYMTLNAGDLKEHGIFAVRIKPIDKESTIAFIRRQFGLFFPNAVVDVADFDNDLDVGTKGVWEVVEKVFIGFGIIAVFIAANGLFGMISFASQRRMKEVGIRKVFGANSPQLYLMMSREVIFILLFSALIAFPSGYLVSHTTPGAYKYQLQFMDYIICIGLMVFTALAASIYHTTKAVLSNPVETLRYE
jgi:putative ABC transport system permease protein